MRTANRIITFEGDFHSRGKDLLISRVEFHTCALRLKNSDCMPLMQLSNLLILRALNCVTKY
jgi:hypothetical protein